MAAGGTEQFVVVMKVGNSTGAKGLRWYNELTVNYLGGAVSKSKPFEISKAEVWKAWQQVEANRGGYGVDLQSLEEFKLRLKDNLYKLWNRMSSGSYFPPSVRGVDIPKANGGIRRLGIPTVSDRVAQAVIKNLLEPSVEPQFHDNSYGYRPGRSAHDAIAITTASASKFLK